MVRWLEVDHECPPFGPTKKSLWDTAKETAQPKIFPRLGRILREISGCQPNVIADSAGDQLTRRRLSIAGRTYGNSGSGKVGAQKSREIDW